MTVEPQTGFEPAFHAWKARALPFELLRHVCILFQLSQSVAVCQRPGSDFRVCGVTCPVVPQVYRSESVRLPRMGATQPRSALMQTPRAYLPACCTPYYKQ